MNYYGINITSGEPDYIPFPLDPPRGAGHREGVRVGVTSVADWKDPSVFSDGCMSRSFSLLNYSSLFLQQGLRCVQW